MAIRPHNAALAAREEIMADAGASTAPFLRPSPQVPPLAVVSPAVRRVAVADDDPESRALVRDILRDSGTEVAEAANGAELIQLLAEQGPFDLIVTDIDMPWMQGLQVLRSARAADIRTPAVVITGLTRPDLDVQVARLGVTRLLRKPFGAAELRRAILSVLAERP